MRKELITGVKEKPVKSILISSVLLFWIFAPLIMQKYYNISAIKASFSITVLYFVSWKIYERKDNISDVLS